MAHNSPLEANTPLSPCSPSALSGTTFEYQHNDDIELESRDAEAQRSTPKRESLLNRLGMTIPPHWKPGNLNEHRIHRNVEQYPIGFAKFAAWMNCDENFLIARRYGWLHNRVMMFRSSELHELELTLESVDEELRGEGKYDALRDHESFKYGEAGVRRTQLIQDIDDKLAQYGNPSHATSAEGFEN